MKTITWTFTFAGGETCTATGTFSALLGGSEIKYTGRTDLLAAAAHGDDLPKNADGQGFESFKYFFDLKVFVDARMTDDGGEWLLLEL